MIIPMLCVTIFVILVVWFLLPRVARLMIHTPTAISIFVCLSMVQLMAVFISMRCTLCGHFLQVALTLILVVGYAIAASALLQRIFLMSSLMLLLVWLIFFMVLIKLLPILGTISGKTVKLMVLALICLGNNRQD